LKGIIVKLIKQLFICAVFTNLVVCADAEWGYLENKGKIQQNRPFKVLIVGDSILGGYHNYVISSLRGVAVTDCWITPIHLNSIGIFNQMYDNIKGKGYDVIHFNIGLHGLSEDRVAQINYEAAIEQYVVFLQKIAPEAQLIWRNITPQFTNDPDTPKQLDKNSNPRIVERNKLAARVMKKRNVMIHDLYSAVVDKPELFRDAFHCTPAGMSLQGKHVADFILATLNRNYKKIAALTFDDGPVPGETEKIVSILEANNVEGTFFQVGKNIRANPGMTKMLFDKGYGIGNHTFSHLKLTALDDAKIKAEVETTQNEITKATGRHRTRAFRSPWLQKNAKVMEILKANNLTLYDSPLYGRKNFSEKAGDTEIFVLPEKFATEGGMLLFHDNDKEDQKILGDIISQLKLNGFKLVTAEGYHRIKNAKF
jgi:peptidoglycan/xylan/chitin deacetylase (PgdA/CDA1 family)